VTSPQNGSFTKSSTIAVTGVAPDDVGIADVLVNEVPAILSGSSFSASLAISEGSNDVNVVATDRAGRQSSID